MSNDTLRLLTRTLLVGGALGYPIAFWWVLRLRRWLADDARGWVLAILNGLLGLLGGLAALFFLSLGGEFGWFRHLSRNWYLAIAIATVGILSLAPWLLWLSLWLWERQAAQPTQRPEARARHGAVPDLGDER